MFQELMLLIQTRPLTITVAAVDGSRIRVNVVPHPVANDKKANAQIGYNHNKEVAPIPETALNGLITPLCLTGTPEEIDQGLADTLARFTSLHAGLQQCYDQAAAAIAESVKAIDERERIKKEKDKASKKPNPPSAEEKTSDDAPLPSLWTTQGQTSPTAAVSANDAPSSATAQAGPGLAGQS